MSTARKTSTPTFAIGVDYGTNSVRALVVNTASGREVATHVYGYPSGEAGIILDSRDPHLARQNPADYIEGFYRSVRNAVRKAGETRGFKPDRVVGIGIDTTGSTPLPVNRHGTPLAFDKRFKNNPAAHAWLWRDHTSHEEAAEITENASRSRTKYLAKCGGVYSSEWYWSKILHCRRSAPKVFDAAYGWVELADFIPGFITGNTDPDTMPRGICAAGHKAMFHTEWGGLPSKRFLASLDPALADLRDRYTQTPLPSDRKAGRLIEPVAKKVGLPAGIPVAIGAFDAHMGAVASGVKPGTFVKIIGTSTCDIAVWPLNKPLPDIPGLCGIVPESVMPGMYGLEAGQSAVGDIFNWFVKHLSPTRFGNGAAAHAKLTRDAEKLAPGQSGLLALDWNNGNRTVLVDPLLTGVVLGQTLHTTAPEVYRALVESTAFGALTIINRFEQFGVKINQIVNCGGISEKNAMVMQVYADVCNRPIKISRSAQTCALGAAIYGAIVGGAHRTVPAAQKAMTGMKDRVFRPIRKNAQVYAELFKLYARLHDAFSSTGTHSNVMKDLITIRKTAGWGRTHA